MSARSEAEKFLEGARIAYDDCAAMLEHLAAQAGGFGAHVAGSGVDTPPHLVAAVEIAAKAILSAASDTIRAKRAELDRRVNAAKTTPQTSRAHQ